jgi:hypothetical protein
MHAQTELINSMEQNDSLEANNCSATQEFYGTQKVHYSVNTSLLLVPNQSQSTTSLSISV